MTTISRSASPDHLFNLLSAIAHDGGTVYPRWTPHENTAYAYVIDEQRIDDSALESLVEADYLQRSFVERISRCPSCRSHLLNMREICAACKSPRVYPVELLHHFRCGYVAPSYEFTLENDGRRCPKCHGMLRDRGTDHDVPGPHFGCQACERTFQMPELSALCLGCGNVLNGVDLEKVIFEDVWAYKTSLHGAAALRAGGFREKGSQEIREGDLPLLRRSVFMEYLEDERKRRRRFRSNFALLLVTVRPPAGDSARSDEASLLAALAEQLTETDKLGRYDERNYLALLPSTDARDAEKTAKNLSSGTVPVLRQWNVQARLLALPDGVALREHLSASLNGST